jgi:WD repeat-containing protein 24
MSDASLLPPPAPPLPPARLGPLQRFIAPLGFSKASGRQETRGSQPARVAPESVSRRSYGNLPSHTPAHRTGIPIAALDVNQHKTHAILAGKEILKTVRVQDSKVTEEFNLRSSIVSYASNHGSPQGESMARRREYLPARDVRWSVGRFDHIIATAAANGRIALYDVNAAGSRIELAWLHEHQGQVNKLDFDPFGGYWLLSASQDKTVRLWDIREPKATRSKQRFDVRSGVRDVRWSPKEGNDFDFAVCADGGIIQNWDARNPLGPKLSINAHERGCYSLDWHPDGRHVVSGGFDKYVRVWDFKSDNRKQKPTYQFRAPQAIRIVRWRPTTATHVSKEGVIKQTAQIATTYHVDDPRMHLWDLRRPLLPDRELDTYNTPANDFLWASQDLLWSVGDQGMFTQNDVRFAPQVQDSLPPSAVDWMPDGRCAMLMEERGARRPLELVDPLAGFLDVSEQKLSGEDGNSTFDIEAEDAANESLLFRKRQNRNLSSRSIHSQTNSPPVSEGFIQQLDQTMLASKDLLQNDQTGVVVSVEGIAADPEVVEFLTTHYSSPATERERRTSPSLILERLEACFITNANACDETCLHRLAQSWRMLSAVIVPELRDWADGNRSARLAEAAKRLDKEAQLRELKKSAAPSPFAKITTQDFQTKLDVKDGKVISSLFRGLKDSGKNTNNGEPSNSSNTTTPLARPVTDSPRRIPNAHRSKTSNDSKEEMDDLQALPPSLLNSHTTASAAAKALLDQSSIASDSPPSSPEQQRQSSSKIKPYTSEEIKLLKENATNADPRRTQGQISDPLSLRPKRSQAQEQEAQRMALRDYRAQARPIFTLDARVKSPQQGASGLRDSAESFSMFPASASSSRKEKSLGESLMSQDRSSTSSTQEKGWLSREDSHASESSTGLASPYQKPGTEANRPRSGFYGSNDFSTGLDGSAESKEDSSSNSDYQKRSENSDELPVTSMASQPVLSSSPELFYFDPSYSPPHAKIHSVNPMSNSSLAVTKKSTAGAAASAVQIESSLEVMASESYIISDFRPVDLSKHNPRLPFAWSALPLICQMIAFDMENGLAGAQFAAHLLLHVAPYFFSRERQDSKVLPSSWPESVAERLMVPGLSHRIIEALLLNHRTFLRRMQLFDSMAEMRKLCAAMGYERVVQPGFQQQQDAKDPYVVGSVCVHCQGAIEAGRDTCSRCLKARLPCPICLSTRLQLAQPSTDADLTNLVAPHLWMFCHACGHSAHTSCMQDWLSQVFAEGHCPTPGCPCDCGPGVVRDARIEAQVKANEERKLIRGSGGSTSVTKKDPVKATHSPAVDKARHMLGRAASNDRGTQSSDERSSIPTRRVSERGRGRKSIGASGLGAGSSRKSVRLMAPGEESR